MLLKKILIVGGRGFIGSHLCAELSAKGYHVHTLSRGKPDKGVSGLFFHHRGDAANAAPLLQSLQPLFSIIYLAHEGWPGSPGREQEIMDHCLGPYTALLQASCRRPPEKFLYVSSGGAVYGNHPGPTLAEDTPLEPVSLYGKIKRQAELMGREARQNQGLPFLVARPGNAYGQGQVPGRGAGFVAAAIADIRQGMEVPVFGFPGTVRDYLHVRDLVRGIRLLIESGEAGEAYNLGTGKGTDNREILETLRSLAKAEGLSVQVREEPARSCDVRSVVLESSKAFRTCGWQAEISLQEGVPEMWRSASIHAGTPS